MVKESKPSGLLVDQSTTQLKPEAWERPGSTPYHIFAFIYLPWLLDGENNALQRTDADESSTKSAKRKHLHYTLFAALPFSGLSGALNATEAKF